MYVPMVSEATKSNGELRRHSSGKTSSENNEHKVVPHYLRASTGSCHDFSKYGKKLALEAKKRSFIPRIGEREQLHQRSKEKVGEVVETSGVKFRASTDSGPKKMPLLNLRTSNDYEPTKTSLVKHRSTDSETTKTPLVKLRASTDSKPTKMSLVKSRESTDSEVVVDKKKTSTVEVKQSSLHPKSHNSSAYKTRRQEISSTFKMETTPKPIFKRIGPSSISTSKKEESQLKSNSKRVKTPISTSHSAKTSSKSTSKKMQTSSKLFEKHATLKLDSSKVASPLRDYSSLKSSGNRVTGINMHKSFKTAVRVKNQPKPRKVEADEHNNEAEEKTLYVIMVGSEGQASSINQTSSQEDQKESEYATSEIEENGKLVLRHQNLKGKKDEQVLMNNLIEETSRKLVGTPMSKVKALVGAFETLISLNERKTCSSTFN